MDDRYLEPQDVASFIQICRERTLTKAVIAWQDEWAQTPLPDQVNYDRVRETTLLAYHGGTIIRFVSKTLLKDEAQATLTAAGMTVELRSRNLTR
jgi:hypothetical protein